jgi:hypothetical protein
VGSVGDDSLLDGPDLDQYPAQYIPVAIIHDAANLDSGQVS